MPFRFRRSGHIVIRCADADRSARFFQEVVGLAQHGETQRGMRFLTADFAENHHMLLVRPARPGAPAPDPERRIGFARVAYEVRTPAALAALRVRLQAADVEPLDGRTADAVAFRDPDGNLFEFFCRTPAEATSGARTGAREPA